MDYSTLAPGDVVSQRTHTLDTGAVSRYADAVGDRCRMRLGTDGPELAPPMAVAALSLRGVVNDLAIPGGTVHAGQELEFKGGVAVGETLDCRATLEHNSVRGEWRFITVRLEVDDSRGQRVLEGKSTIMLPG